MVRLSVWNALSPMEVMVSGRKISWSSVQLRKHRSGTVVMPRPRVREASPSQEEKALVPRLVTVSGRVREVKPSQPEKALSPIVVRPRPRIRPVKPEQPEKAESSMEVTESGMEMCIRDRCH